MVTAQCDSIMVTRFLRPLASDVLNEFERFFRVGNPDHWFMLYACTFMLLHEVSFSSQDRYRHAAENWITDVCLPIFLASCTIQVYPPDTRLGQIFRL